MRGPGGLVLAAGLVLAGCLGAPPAGPGAPGAPEAPSPPDALGAFPPDAPFGATRLFAPVGPPGFPEGIAVGGGRVYVTASNGSEDTGEVQAFDLATAQLVERLTLPKPTSDFSRLLGLAFDAAGKLYILDTSAGRVLRLDLASPQPVPETYAAFPDLPPCATTLPGAGCAPTLEDTPPVPNYLVFGPGGEGYVSDFLQATIWRVPAGGGDPEAWFQDARFGTRGANGLAVGPGDAHLYVGQSLLARPTSAPAVGAAGGAVHRLPLRDAPTPAELELFRHYPSAAVDGIAFGASGRLYVTLVGQLGAPHGISVLDPQGEEVAFFPAPEDNERLGVPYHGPASVAFHEAHRSILVTNQAFGAPEHWAILESFVDDVALPLHRP